MSSPRELVALLRQADGLAEASRWGNVSRVPPMLILTDPQRTPDPIALAERLPRGAGLVYRAFGAPDAFATGRALAKMARARGWMLLVGADVELAQACGAQGVHLPERSIWRAPRLRARWPGVRITGAAHSGHALIRAAACGLDAALLSVVFASRSASAGLPIGPLRFAALARDARLPVYALGGVDASTALRLAGTGVAGLAAVGAAVRPGPRPVTG